MSREQKAPLNHAMLQVCYPLFLLYLFTYAGVTGGAESIELVLVASHPIVWSFQLVDDNIQVPSSHPAAL